MYFSFLVCTFYGFCGGLFGFNSLFSLMMISIDRYLALTRPVGPASSKNPKRVALMIVLTWIFAIALSTPPFYGMGEYCFPEITYEVSPNSQR